MFDASNEAPRWRLPLSRPFICAHRGGAHLFPENTLEAFRASAEKYGCRFMEMDVRVTADGVPVVIHDEDVLRVTGTAGLVHELDLPQLQSLDAAASFVSVQGESWAGRGICIPTLEAVLRALPECIFSIDVKQRAPRCEDAVIGVIRECGMAANVLLGAEDGATSKRLRKMAPEAPSFFSRPAVIGFYAALRCGLLRWYSPPHNSMQIPERAFGLPLVTTRLVRHAQRKGIAVIVWTVNEPATMARLLDLGVDGIITDRPDLLQDVIAARA